MTYHVTLDVYQGAKTRREYRTTYTVEEAAPLSAMSKAEQHLNVQLPDDQYAVARHAVIPIHQNWPTATTVAA